jgi:hypothetical protein
MFGGLLGIVWYVIKHIENNSCTCSFLYVYRCLALTTERITRCKVQFCQKCSLLLSSVKPHQNQSST